MCDPVSALMIAGGAVSGFGQISSGIAANNAAKFNAQVQEQNAVLAERRARDAVERGKLEEEKAKREATQTRKAQEASFSASNLDLGFGSPLDVIVATATAGELNAATIRASAEREAEDFETQATNSRNSAEITRMEGRNAKRGGFIGGFGSVLDGGAGVLKFRAQQTV